MLDIKFIRENPKVVSDKARQKGYPVDIQKLLKVDEERRKLIDEVDQLRSHRKLAADARDEKKGNEIKSALKSKENKLEKLQEDFYKLIRNVPNIPKDDVPFGKDESQNEIVKTWGKKPDFGFKPKDHVFVRCFGSENLNLILQKNQKFISSETRAKYFEVKEDISGAAWIKKEITVDSQNLKIAIKKIK